MTDKKVEVKKEQPTAKGFLKEYNLLCEKMGFRIVVSPTWVGTNHGSFEMTIQYQVGEMPKK